MSVDMEVGNRDVLEHSESLESRDNPFLPGGELSKEAEDLLSRATIIRDNFYLNEEERRALRDKQQQEQEQQLEQQQVQQEQQQQQQQQPGKKPGKHVQIVDHVDGPKVDGDTSRSSQPPLQAVDERICVSASTGTVSATPASGKPSNGNGASADLSVAPRLENGGGSGQTAPSDVTVTVTGSDGDGQTSPLATESGAPNTHPDGLAVQDADKKKARNKCCSVM